MTKPVEIAASTHGFIRIIQTGPKFEVQTKRIRGEHKRGCLTYWHTLYAVWDQTKAFALYQNLA
jgi:hypothetical protein